MHPVELGKAYLSNCADQYTSQPILRKQCHDGTTHESLYQYEVPQTSRCTDSQFSAWRHAAAAIFNSTAIDSHPRITIPKMVDESAYLKHLLDYTLITSRKCLSRDLKKEGSRTWVRTELFTERLPQEAIIKQMLDESRRRAPLEKKSLTDNLGRKIPLFSRASRSQTEVEPTPLSGRFLFSSMQYGS